MKKLVVALVLGLVSSWNAVAADGAALTASCAACHGADGNSLAPAFPKLAGQHEKYLLKQLQDIKSGARSVPTMAGQLDAASDDDLAAMAAFFAVNAPTPGVAKAELVELGESVYRAGVKSKGVAACAACHSPTGSGNGPAGFPMLSGQHAEYTAMTLRAFRTGERANDGDTRMMRDVAYRMSDAEIEAVSSYIAGLR